MVVLVYCKAVKIKMFKMTASRAFNAYLCVGVAYQLGRFWYYNNECSEKRYYKNPETGNYEVKHHDLLFRTKLVAGVCSVGLYGFWPISAVQDIDVYQCRKLNYENILPPFPFNNMNYVFKN